MLLKKYFAGDPRATLIQSQRHMRNLDSGVRPCFFENLKNQIHSSNLDTFSTASVRIVASAPKQMCPVLLQKLPCRARFLPVEKCQQLPSRRLLVSDPTIVSLIGIAPIGSCPRDVLHRLRQQAMVLFLMIA
jgi:hypothetical protein